MLPGSGLLYGRVDDGEAADRWEGGVEGPDLVDPMLETDCGYLKIEDSCAQRPHFTGELEQPQEISCSWENDGKQPLEPAEEQLNFVRVGTDAARLCDYAPEFTDAERRDVDLRARADSPCE